MNKCLLWLAFTALPVQAATTHPLIVKVNMSGYVAPDWGRDERCEVYADRVVITREYGRSSNHVVTTETKPLQISPSIDSVIRQAATEPLTSKQNSLCDGPASTLIAQSDTADSSQVLLFSTGGCGNASQERTGGASMILRDLINTYCPGTFGADNQHLGE